MLAVLFLSVVLSGAGASDQAAAQQPPPMSPSESTAEYRRKVHLYGERLGAGENLRIGVEVPPEDRSELLTAFGNVAMALFDADGSGGLNQEEWLERTWRFELLSDVDGDGLVSREEYLQGRARNTHRNTDLGEFLSPFQREDERRFRRLSPAGTPLERRALAREARQTFRINDHNRDGEVTNSDLRNLGRSR
ncbi:hypothetical protein [Methylorubrum thiocyanatum]|uniref:hypothetical protein n=1 Tax=Methylorubrum thiocyanatum TaxID=47958 RepID=UPI0035C83CF9